jgi:hypothetical protein
MFDRQAGRVTELLAKPLLDIYFPELNQFFTTIEWNFQVKGAFWKISFLKMIME